jgi:hypothetical protein
MPTVYGPPVSGVVGLEAGEKPVRADFSRRVFDTAIEQKGARLVWSRGTPCPCEGLNRQTEQTDPSCALCDGHGWHFFGPKGYAAPVEAGELDDLQQKLVAQDGGAVIRGIMTGVGLQQDPVTQLGAWLFGSSMLTVRPENRLGYYDRIVHLDSIVPYAQILRVGNAADPVKTRFLVRAVNLLRSVERRYDEGADFTIETGVIKWITGRAPSSGTRITVHYLCHPQWLVVEQPKVLREETSKAKGRKRIAPVGEPVPLPVQAMIKLEYLVAP